MKDQFYTVFLINGEFIDDDAPWVRIDDVTKGELSVLIDLAARNDSDIVIRAEDAEDGAGA